MSAHTPGPWVVDDDRKGRTLMVIAEKGGMAVIVNDVGRKATAQNRADAKLIAAAPDLLAVAKLALSHYPALGALDYEVISAAVAKAEGLA